MMITNINNFNNSSIKSPRAKTNNLPSSLSNRNELSKLLFGRVSNSNVSFGWSKGVAPEEEKILNILTDPSIKTAMVGAHSRPDGDAYGSTIGLCGILQRMGVRVFPTIDDKKPADFANMPSSNKCFTATELMKDVKGTVETLNKENITNPDVAIIADCANPTMPSPELVQSFAKAKNIIIIDHHPDQNGEPTNKEQWIKTFEEKGVDAKNITYWREERVAAAEMIGELDKEVDIEAKKGSIAQHNPEYYKNYRIAIASGIYTDAGGVNGTKGNTDNISIARLTDKKIQSESGKFESITRNVFNWLLENCGIKKAEIDINSASRASLPKEIELIIDDVLDGKKQIKGIFIKPTTENDHVYCYYQNNWYGLNDLADRANKINGNSNLTAGDVRSIIKHKLEDKIVQDKNNGLTIIAGNNPKNNSFALSLRSYGYEALKGETYIKGHVFTDKLATEAMDALKDAGLGEGGGHANATGMRGSDNVNFMNDALPVILKTYKEKTAGKDLRAIPDYLKADVVDLIKKDIKTA